MGSKLDPFFIWLKYSNWIRTDEVHPNSHSGLGSNLEMDLVLKIGFENRPDLDQFGPFIYLNLVEI